MDSIRMRDLHIVKYCSSFVSISEGKVFYVSDPKVKPCPLARHFYKEIFKGNEDNEGIKKGIKEVIEFKIKEYGFFTANRKFDICEMQVPYGASEILMFALRNKAIDAAVVVCDGAGTVISDSPEVVQGIGARMHNIIMTSPIFETIEHLNSIGCSVISKNSIIDQSSGVRKAAEMGHKIIGVTIDGQSAQELKRLKDIEEEYGVKVISLVICTTGLKRELVEKIKEYADLVWSCVSDEVHKLIRPAAKLRLSNLMPVFAISDAGVGFALNYNPEYKDNKRVGMALTK